MRPLIKWCILLSFAIISCNEEAIKSYNQHNKIEVLALKRSASTKTNTSGLTTTWLAGDRIGVFSPQSRNTPEGAPGVVNACYTANNSGTISSFSGSMYWGDQVSNFYAYYPYKADVLSYNNLPVSVPSVQTQLSGNDLSHISTLDYLVSKPIISHPYGVTGESASVSFSFNHIFALMEFKFTRTSTTGSINKIKLSSSDTLSFQSANIDISTPIGIYGPIFKNILTSAKSVELILSSPIVPTSDFSTTQSAFILVKPSPNHSNLKIWVESGSEYKNIDINTPLGGLMAGHIYKYNVNADILVVPPPEYPGTSMAPVLINNLWWAPVNLGYDFDPPFGLLYQFGRKVGMKYNNTSQLTVAVLPSISYGSDITTLNKFIFKSDVNYRWYSEIAEIQWNNERQYNPCPEGWRIPTANELLNLFATSKTNVTLPCIGMWVGNNTNDPILREKTAIFIPHSGYIGPNASSSFRGESAYFWTSVMPVTGIGSRVMSSTGTQTNAASYWGYSVRCVKDK